MDNLAISVDFGSFGVFGEVLHEPLAHAVIGVLLALSGGLGTLKTRQPHFGIIQASDVLLHLGIGDTGGASLARLALAHNHSEVQGHELAHFGKGIARQIGHGFMLKLLGDGDGTGGEVDGVVHVLLGVAHSSYLARALERKGILSDRCELNRQIKADNNLIRELKAEIKQLEKQARGDDKALAVALEQNQNAIIMIRYQIIFNYAQITKMKSEREKAMPIIHDYHNVMKKLKPIQKQRAALRKELDNCSPVQLIRKAQLQKQIDELSTEMAPYATKRTDLLKVLGCKDDKAVGELEKRMESIRSSIAQAEHRANVMDGQHGEQMARHLKLMNRITPDNAVVVDAERNEIRQEQRDAMLQKMHDTYGTLFEQTTMNHAVKITEDIIRRETKPVAVKDHAAIRAEERE